MDLITTENELKKAFDTVNFVEQTCAQINKDLNGLSERIISTRQLNDPLADFIEQLIPIGYNDMLNVMVDIHHLFFLYMRLDIFLLII